MLLYTKKERNKLINFSGEMKNRAPGVLRKQLQTEQKTEANESTTKKSRWQVKSRRSWITKCKWQQKHQIHLRSGVYFSLSFMLSATYSSAAPCLFIHAAHCEVINKRAGRLGLFSAVAGAQLSGRGANMSFNLFTQGPHSGIKGPQAAWKRFNRTSNAKYIG